MRSIFVNTFIAFVAALMIFMAIMLAILVFGFNYSLHKLDYEKAAVLQKSINSIFLNTYKRFGVLEEEVFYGAMEDILRGNFYISVYDDKKAPLFDIKRGKHFAEYSFKTFENTKFALTYQNKILLYYELHFRREDAERNFFRTVYLSVITGFFASFLMALLFAYLFSRRLSHSARNALFMINRIAENDFSVSIEEKHTREFALIAASAGVLAKKLKKEEELRNQWTGDIAHDLRTPVTALKTQLEGMMDGVLDLSPERITKNLHQLDKLEYLINDLAELTRLESPAAFLHKSTIDAEAFFNQFLILFHRQIEEKKLSFEVKMDLKTLNGDENLLHRAFANLLHNAVKFASPPGRVEIEGHTHLGRPVITVFNTGSFIPPGDSGKIFDRLYRAELARHTEGTGLGLTISRKIIELHKGTIRVESSRKDGTRFIVEL